MATSSSANALPPKPAGVVSPPPLAFPPPKLVAPGAPPTASPPVPADYATVGSTPTAPDSAASPKAGVSLDAGSTQAPTWLQQSVLDADHGSLGRWSQLDASAKSRIERWLHQPEVRKLDRAVKSSLVALWLSPRPPSSPTAVAKLATSPSFGRLEVLQQLQLLRSLVSHRDQGTRALVELLPLVANCPKAEHPVLLSTLLGLSDAQLVGASKGDLGPSRALFGKRGADIISRIPTAQSSAGILRQEIAFWALRHARAPEAVCDALTAATEAGNYPAPFIYLLFTNVADAAELQAFTTVMRAVGPPLEVDSAVLTLSVLKPTPEAMKRFAAGRESNLLERAYIAMYGSTAASIHSNEGLLLAIAVSTKWPVATRAELFQSPPAIAAEIATFTSFEGGASPTVDIIRELADRTAEQRRDLARIDTLLAGGVSLTELLELPKEAISTIAKLDEALLRTRLGSLLALRARASNVDETQRGAVLIRAAQDPDFGKASLVYWRRLDDQIGGLGQAAQCSAQRLWKGLAAKAKNPNDLDKLQQQFFVINQAGLDEALVTLVEKYGLTAVVSSFADTLSAPLSEAFERQLPAGVRASYRELVRHPRWSKLDPAAVVAVIYELGRAKPTNELAHLVRDNLNHRTSGDWFSAADCAALICSGAALTTALSRASATPPGPNIPSPRALLQRAIDTMRTARVRGYHYATSQGGAADSSGEITLDPRRAGKDVAVHEVVHVLFKHCSEPHTIAERFKNEYTAYFAQSIVDTGRRPTRAALAQSFQGLLSPKGIYQHLYAAELNKEPPTNDALAIMEFVNSFLVKPVTKPSELAVEAPLRFKSGFAPVPKELASL